jgi:hypothetical protein
MTQRLKAGAIGGVAGGIAMGIMMTLMDAPTPDGNRVPMISMVAMILGSPSLVVGWAYHLFNSAVIGGLFGLAADQFGVRSTRSALLAGSVYGALWWVLGGLILMPLLLGMPVFAPLLMAPMRVVAIGSLVGHVIFGVILGFAYARVRERRTAFAAA